MRVPPKALKRFLKQLGFKTDTSTLSRLYEAEGVCSVVRRINGTPTRMIEISPWAGADASMDRPVSPGHQRRREQLHEISRELIDLFVEERLNAAGDCVALTGPELHLLLQLVGIERRN